MRSYEDWVPNPDMVDPYDLIHRHRPLEQPPASYRYLVFSRAGDFYVKDGITGCIVQGPLTDAAAAQWAFDNLTPGRTFKEKVLLIGAFTLSAKLEIPSYVILEIHGVLTLADGVNDDILENSDQTAGNEHIEVHGGILKGNKAEQTAGAGIDFDKVSNVLISRVHIEDCKNEGIRAGLNGTCSHVKIEFCGISGCEYDIHTRRCEHLTISECKTSTATYEGIYVHSLCKYVVIENNEAFSNGRQGIAVESAEQADVTGNSCHDNTQNGIVIELSSKVDVSDNQCPDNGSAASGIGVITCTEITIEGNKCKGNGFGTLTNSDGTIINDNQCWLNGRDGIKTNEASDCVVSGNICKNNSQETANSYQGIYIYGSAGTPAYDNVVTGNRCYDDQEPKTQQYGIAEGGTVDWSVITGNGLRGNRTGSLATAGANTLYRTATDLDPLNVV